MNIDDARRCLRLLAAGFPTYPLPDDSSELYLRALTEKVLDGAVGFAVVTDWIETRMTFPKVAELLEECAAESKRRMAQAKALQSAKSDGLVEGHCNRCGGGQFIDHLGEDGRLLGVSPCPDCRPDLAAYWREGHEDPGHDPEACSHPLCIAKARKARSRR